MPSPGWYPDPSPRADPETQVPPSNWTPTRRMRARVAVWKAAIQMRAQRRAYVRVGAVAVVLVVGLYLFVTVGNSFLFNYDFFNDPAPSSTADSVAVVSLWVLGLFEAIVTTAAFGAFCALGLGTSSAGGALRVSLRQLKRDGWWALPAAIVAVIAHVVVVPGALVAGPLAAIAVSRVSDRPTRPGYVGRVVGQQLGIGILPCGLSLAIWSTIFLAASFPSLPIWVALLMLMMGVVVSVAVMAWTAAASAQIYLDDVRSLRSRPS